MLLPVNPLHVPYPPYDAFKQLRVPSPFYAADALNSFLLKSFYFTPFKRLSIFGLIFEYAVFTSYFSFSLFYKKFYDSKFS